MIIQMPSLVLAYQQLNLLSLTQVTGAAMLVLGTHPVGPRGLSPFVRSLSSGIGSVLIGSVQRLVLWQIACDEFALPITMRSDRLKRKKCIVRERIEDAHIDNPS